MLVYNSLTFQKEKFKPLNPDKVLMYVCGPTVYDSPHLGHAKSAVAFDLIRRYLEYKGFNVKIVKNYTDIDDKIIKRANEKKMDFKELSEKYIEEYDTIMRILNIKPESRTPRATEIIDFMIEVIQTLIEKGYAYESNGSVYFAVKKYPGYNTIFQNKEEEEYIEYEIPVDEKPLYGDKYDPNDFVLWKAWKEGEPYWESPWGKGRPGWHIECSCMAIKFLGDVIDIHGGGLDLKSPHHKNEIVQSTAYTGEDIFAKYFLHNGFIEVDQEKMSKSLGNFFLVSDLLEKFDPMVIRFFLISSHYRSSANFTMNSIQQAEKNYKKLINTLKKVCDLKPSSIESQEISDLISKLKEAKSRIVTFMDNDFSTPEAIAEILTLFNDINRVIFEENVKITPDFQSEFLGFVEDLEHIFGIFPNLPSLLTYGITQPVGDNDKLINDLLNLLKETREELRERKLYEISDKIRVKLKELGIQIEDH
jgi:cysteinyl-tRNA synthetase